MCQKRIVDNSSPLCYTFHRMTEFLISVITATAIQIIGLVGIFFILGFLLSKLQEWTQKNYFRSVGWKGILWTAWIGTPIHELGHIFFAKLFRHRITRVAIFQPNADTGELGHVDHSYSPSSLYQKIGNFFIGAAPMIFGSLVLFALVYWLLPNGDAAFLPLTEKHGSLNGALSAIRKTLGAFLSWENGRQWYFWLFLYISFSIGSHLAPSKADRKSMWSGLRWIIGVLLLLNIFTVLFRLDATRYILASAKYLSIAASLFVYALIISFAHWVFSLGLRVVARR